MVAMLAAYAADSTSILITVVLVLAAIALLIFILRR